jgi:hypothetical protein
MVVVVATLAVSTKSNKKQVHIQYKPYKSSHVHASPRNSGAYELRTGIGEAPADPSLWVFSPAKVVLLLDDDSLWLRESRVSEVGMSPGRGGCHRAACFTFGLHVPVRTARPPDDAIRGNCKGKLSSRTPCRYYSKPHIQ